MDALNEQIGFRHTDGQGSIMTLDAFGLLALCQQCVRVGAGSVAELVLLL